MLHFIKKKFWSSFITCFEKHYFKLMLLSSTISTQKYWLFAGRENGCCSESTGVSACRKYHFVTSFVGRGKTGVGCHPPPHHSGFFKRPSDWYSFVHFSGYKLKINIKMRSSIDLDIHNSEVFSSEFKVKICGSGDKFTSRPVQRKSPSRNTYKDNGSLSSKPWNSSMKLFI